MWRAPFISIPLIAASAATATTVQDPDRPAVIGPDGRILGDRDSIRLERWIAPGVVDTEPMYVVLHDDQAVGFARHGDQCTDGKLSAEIVPCEGDVARMGEAVRDLATAGRPPLTLDIQAPSVMLPMPTTWADPYLPFGLFGGRPAVIITAPVTPTTPNLPAVPVPSAAWGLISACAALIGLRAFRRS